MSPFFREIFYAFGDTKVKVVHKYNFLNAVSSWRIAEVFLL